MRLAICIGTYRRRELLRRLLNGIAKLHFRKMPAPDIEIIVVDNDISRSGELTCQQVLLPWAVKYIVESRRGIAHVRNTAIAEAVNADFIALIDDDEVPVPEWLDELLWTQAHFNADVVTGPVMPQFEHGVSQWVKDGGFFDWCQHPTGTTIMFAYTGNALVRLNVLADVASFDHEFALSGAEDTHFFLRVRQAGHTIIWSQEAVVREMIPVGRANIAWILRRQYQIGNSWVFCESKLDGRLKIRVVRLAKAGGHITKGLSSALISMFFGKAALVRSLQGLCRGVGMLAALVGSKYLPYQAAGADSAIPIIEGEVPCVVRRRIDPRVQKWLARHRQ